jgi:hypothetical protein
VHTGEMTLWLRKASRACVFEMWTSITGTSRSGRNLVSVAP